MIYLCHFVLGIMYKVCNRFSLKHLLLYQTIKCELYFFYQVVPVLCQFFFDIELAKVLGCQLNVMCQQQIKLILFVFHAIYMVVRSPNP